MCARNPKKSVWISVENTTNSIMDEKKTPQIKRQKSIDSAVNMNGDETDGVPTRIAMPVAERRRHFRKMQSMGSLCNTPVMFSLTNQVTSVAQALKAVKNSNGSDTLARSLTRSLSIHRSTSREGRCCHCGDDAEKFDSEDSSELLNRLVHKLQKQMDYMEKSLSNQFETYISCGEKETKETTEKRYEVPWFPRKIADLDLCVNRVIPADLPEDYIGYKDNQYRERRSVFAELAYKHKYGQPVPRVEYTEQEKNTWRLVFSELIDLYPKYACKEYLENLQSLREAGVYCEDQVPQLEDVSAFLKERTGFQIRPVSGYLSSRDFLAGLAFRTFACTQYIRHSEETFYTSEPDICHELMGHVPMFADKSFAQFSQEIGLASLGASDEDIKNLASCYFFTIEFGLCKQNGQTKVYGAGLLSSSDELKHAMEVDLKPFTPDGAIEQECRISTFQDAYFITDSFTGAKNLMREYAGKVQRPFTVRYDPYTQSIDVLDSVDEMVSMVGGLKDDLRLLTHALAKIQSLEMDSR